MHVITVQGMQSKSKQNHLDLSYLTKVYSSSVLATVATVIYAASRAMYTKYRFI